ncbi:MAG: hypothetical protein JW952_04880, partial [Candidatus Eisenbacteria bacterium]|nr:hypothetical protein [Candidatus Eisenbacteria bacterium]
FLLRRTLVVVPFVLLIGAVNLLGRGLDLAPAWGSWGSGHSWMEVGPAAKEGNDAALVSFGVMAVKSFISVFTFGLLLSTTGSARLLTAARRAGVPAILTVATGFMLRYLFVLVDELSRLRRSWEARRVGRLRWPAEFRYLGSLIGVLLVKSYERAERVYLAMCARGFDGLEPIARASRTGVASEAPPRRRVALTGALFPLLLLGPVLAAVLLRP